MTAVKMIRGNDTPDAPRSSAGFLNRLVDWMNQVVEGFFGPTVGDARQDQPAEAYLFLNPSYCGALIDSDLWDLLIDQRSQWDSEELHDV